MKKITKEMQMLHYKILNTKDRVKEEQREKKMAAKVENQIS
jgi:hypothetical protein